ncbi:MAG: cytochrome c maturation protein CcmE [Gammaproteobacteria bacterium]|nr:cytochrome c maturation protein CcmE [Gammaproteobacteria bacterium]
MTPKRKQRLALIMLMLAGVGIATTLAFMAAGENALFFFYPTQVLAGEAPADRVIRLGGVVSEGSVQRAADSLNVRFEIRDEANSVPVQYTGILPDLFREGQGIVTKGRIGADGVFLAEEVLAKHDENYMPREVAEAMKETGASSPHKPDEN